MFVCISYPGHGGENSHSFHFHGYSFYFVGEGRFPRPITLKQIEEMDKKGEMKRNLDKPPLKDTVKVPNKGYVILRFHANNPGEIYNKKTKSEINTIFSYKREPHSFLVHEYSIFMLFIFLLHLRYCRIEIVGRRLSFIYIACRKFRNRWATGNRIKINKSTNATCNWGSTSCTTYGDGN